AAPPGLGAGRARRAQLVAARPAWNREVDARASPAGHPAAADRRGGARGHPDLFRRRTAGSGATPRPEPAVPDTPSELLRRGDRRRRAGTETGGGDPGPSWGALSRRAPRVSASGARGAAAAPRGRAGQDGARGGRGRLPGAVSARGGHEHVPVWRTRRSLRRLRLLGAEAGGFPAET